jgi:hypothetical protein
MNKGFSRFKSLVRFLKSWWLNSRGKRSSTLLIWAYIITLIVTHLSTFIRHLLDRCEWHYSMGSHHYTCVIAAIYIACCSSTILGRPRATMKMSSCSSTCWTLLIRLNCANIRWVFLYGVIFSSNSILIEDLLVILKLVIRTFYQIWRSSRLSRIWICLLYAI